MPYTIFTIIFSKTWIIFTASFTPFLIVYKFFFTMTL